MQSKTVLMFSLGAALLATPAFSQDENPLYRSEASVQALGSFLKTTTVNGVDQSATNSGGVLASYRFFFNRANGIEVNYGWAPNTQNYGLNGALSSLRTNSHEATAAYVLRYQLKRWSPFVLAGVGGLVFDPRDNVGINAQARAAFVYGGGADINLSRHVFMRAEYRGLVYNSPTWDLPGLAGLDRTTHRAEPSVGFGYRF